METVEASGPFLEDYSVYANLSDEELIQIAIERSLSEDHNATPSTDTGQTPCLPNPEHTQPSSTRRLLGTSTKPSNVTAHYSARIPPTAHYSSHNPPTVHYSLHNPPATHYSSHNPPTTRPLEVQWRATVSTELEPCEAPPNEGVENPLSAAINTGDANQVRALVNVPGCNLLSKVKPAGDGWLVTHQAAATGQEACLRVLLTAQPGMLNKRTEKKAQTALMIAVTKEHVSCVGLLLEWGADLTIANCHLETPLYKACEQGNAELVSMLLSHGAPVHTPCYQGCTALYAAVLQNNVEICEMLVKAGAKISKASGYGMSPLSEAAQSGTLETLRFLLKNGADINSVAADGATPLYEACKNGHVSIVEVLLSLKADVNRSTKSGLLPIHVAVQKGHASIVSLLIPVTARSRIARSGISPLHIAADRNCNDIMELLLEEGFDPDCQLSEERRKKYEDKRSTALYFSVYNSNLEAAGILLEAGANPNLDLFNPLLVAVRRGSMEMASLLLKYGADVNASISTQPSTFPSAVLLTMDYPPMLKMLLDHGCDARSCFTCVYGSKTHPTQTDSEEQSNWNHDAQRSCAQFCEAVSMPSISRLVGPLISMLLNYVGHVRLCCRLMEHLVTSPLWDEIKIKAVPPHPLMQLCRLRIRHLVGVGRLKLIRDLDLPPRLIKFLCYEVDCSLDLDT